MGQETVPVFEVHVHSLHCGVFLNTFSCVFLNTYSCVFPTVTTLLHIFCHLISVVVFLFIFVYETLTGILLFCTCIHFCTASPFISPTFLVVCLCSYLRFRCYSFLFTFLTLYCCLCKSVSQYCHNIC
jgi:hypothetical protein